MCTPTFFHHFCARKQLSDFLFASPSEMGSTVKGRKTPWRAYSLFNSLTTKKQTTKFSSGNFFQKNVRSKLYHIENSKTREQTV